MQVGLPSLELRIDWEASWEAFKALHGEPVPWKGRLLFPDGWTHAEADLRGPEWPAPPDGSPELTALQRAYWTVRRALVRREMQQLHNALMSLKEAQAGRSSPLRVVTDVEERDEQGNLTKVRSVEVSLDDLERGRLADARAEVARCEAELLALSKSKVEQSEQTERVEA